MLSLGAPLRPSAPAMASLPTLAREFGLLGLLEDRAYTAALERLVPALYPDGTAPDPRAVALRDAIFAELREAMRTATHPPRNRMKFGTSGWRGLLFDHFTLPDLPLLTPRLIYPLL